MSDADLVRMANQIAENFCYLDPDEAATRLAAHLRSFWAPPMRRELVALAVGGDGRLSPVTRAACRLLEPGPDDHADERAGAGTKGRR